FYFFSMNNGTVKFYDEIKGFGFIRDSKTSKEYFVHSSGLIDRIRDNDEVTFDLQEGRKGLNAVNVRRS
ncbi:MAG TPA: cold shock domain-containing protein, partial [Bacteroidales bacterium]|nr:cold shock domain-containing protein [Bacteroidales bacterium]